MKTRWLLQPDVFREDAKPLLEAMKKLGVEHTVCQFGRPYESYISSFPGWNKIMFYGSLQFARILQIATTRIMVYCNLPKLDCVYYYPRFGNHLLNSGYILLPFGEIDRRKDWLLDAGSIFLRPSSTFKTFTGFVATNDNWKEVKVLKLKIDPETLVVVAPTRKPKREWRLVVVDGRVITGGQYKDKGNIVRIKDLPKEVFHYAINMLDSSLYDSVSYKPDPAWTLDICETEEGELKVVEVGSFSCSGFYACDIEVIIQAIDDLPAT